MGNGLTPEERGTLWEQFIAAHEKSEEAYDTSIRTLASAGVGVTASLGVALGEFGLVGVAAASAFLGSLVFNLISYVTAQFDLRKRLADLRIGHDEGIEGNRWTTATKLLNALAGLAFIAGGALLALFVTSTT
jgi:hypothetical protein